uniref:ABC transporter domain-containing protein n=1 Tax=Craspedostauros australis TaxID=1486917 RepID=A0A7R9ZSK3_9STRA
MLKRRTGILLNDIRTAADTASIVSGLTLEEVLEPLNGSKTLDPGRQLSAVEKASMLLSMKITGLYTSLLPKLPSKWSTVITANEEDLRPSPLRPRSTVLSPSEWSKLLLAKILAQTISDNDNSAASNDKIDSCLMGSVLILDDPTVLLSEVEEATLLNKIRRTGAATVMSTNKWATGRFADKVAVIKDGRVVETGTHNELLSRGPQQSLYAAKWQAMTMQ